MNLAHRDPHKLLAQLVPTSPPSRYSTRINPPGADSEDSSLLTEDPLAQDLEMYEEASEVGDTTAIVLHWKRTDNVRLVVAHLCRYTFFDSVLVWNNNPEIQLTHKVRVSRSAIEVRPFFMERPRSAHKHHSPPSGRLLPPRAAPPRNSASTTRRATSSSSLASSPARKPIPLTATSKTTTGSCAPCGRCIPSLGGTRKDRWWCRRVIKSRCCLDSSGVSTVRRASLFFRVTDQRERERGRLTFSATVCARRQPLTYVLLLGRDRRLHLSSTRRPFPLPLDLACLPAGRTRPRRQLVHDVSERTAVCRHDERVGTVADSVWT